MKDLMMDSSMDRKILLLKVLLMDLKKVLMKEILVEV